MRLRTVALSMKRKRTNINAFAIHIVMAIMLLPTFLKAQTTKCYNHHNEAAHTDCYYIFPAEPTGMRIL